MTMAPERVEKGDISIWIHLTTTATGTVEVGDITIAQTTPKGIPRRKKEMRRLSTSSIQIRDSTGARGQRQDHLIVTAVTASAMAKLTWKILSPNLDSKLNGTTLGSLKYEGNEKEAGMTQ